MAIDKLLTIEVIHEFRRKYPGFSGFTYINCFNRIVVWFFLSNDFFSAYDRLLSVRLYCLKAGLLCIPAFLLSFILTVKEIFLLYNFISIEHSIVYWS